MTQENEDRSLAFDEVIQQLRTGNSLPAELMEIYSEEAEDHLRTIYDGLSRLQKKSDDMEALADVRRASHTLKGAAGAVNLQAVARLAHRMEDVLDRLAELGEPVSEKQLVLLLTTADQLQDLTSGEFEVEVVARQIVELYQKYSSELGEPRQPVEQVTTDSAPETTAVDRAAQQPRPCDKSNGPTQYLRVPLGRLDELVRLHGEMIVNRSEFQHQLDEFGSRIEDMHNAMERLQTVTGCIENHRSVQDSKKFQGAQSGDQFYFDPQPRPTAQLTPRRDEFDPLEFEQYSEFSLLAQTLSEANNDAEIMSGEFRKVKSSLDALLRRQQQLIRDTQKSLMRIRMVPISSIVSRLERTVRTVSSKLARNVDLEVVGERIELDKTVMDEITDPLLHLIRNAIDHGVEDAESRAIAGKPEKACLRLEAINHGTMVTIIISDDGAGINLEKVRDKAIQGGLIKQDQTLTNDELHALIFLPGFSTAAQLTDVSGRGVGMDVVGEAIGRLKGTIRVQSEAGVGTRFKIQLPTSLGVTRAVLIEASGKTFAIPMDSIQTIQRLDPGSVSDKDGQRKTVVGERTMRLTNLASQLQLVPEDKSAFEFAAPTLILGNSGIDRANDVAVTVDSILGTQDIVVKSLGNHLKNVRGFIGATIGGDGSVIPILDATDLIEDNSPDLISVSQSHYVSPARRQMAMVVDDSISVRRVTENLLTSAGWKTVTAKDGVDALEKLADLDTPPDVFLCDMEMPRMDGIELVRQIREQQEFELTPIVMVTSRASEKHRHKAFEAGATDYVVKPFNDEKLLGLIEQLVQSARETVAELPS